jgi:hypothetical protein
MKKYPVCFYRNHPRNDQQLHPAPKPGLVDRLDVSRKPDPLKDSMKSIVTGFTSSNKSLSIKY